MGNTFWRPEGVGGLRGAYGLGQGFAPLEDTPGNSAADATEIMLSSRLLHSWSIRNTEKRASVHAAGSSPRDGCENNAEKI